MAAREITFAFLLVVAAGLVVAGLATFHSGLALVAAGVLLAGWSFLMLGDVKE